jgi:hypothetical protein
MIRGERCSTTAQKRRSGGGTRNFSEDKSVSITSLCTALQLASHLGHQRRHLSLISLSQVRELRGLKTATEAQIEGFGEGLEQLKAL